MIALVQSWYSASANNMASVHEHDLKNHYYLRDFNALEATKDASFWQQKTGSKLYVADDFGETGIYFYLRTFNVHYTVADSTVYPNSIYLVNNKKWIENSLKTAGIPYRKLYSNAKQFNVFITRSVQ